MWTIKCRIKLTQDNEENLIFNSFFRKIIYSSIFINNKINFDVACFAFIVRSPSPPTLLSEDMRRGMMRKKWEEEQEKLIREGDRDIHYQNVLFDGL